MPEKKISQLEHMAQAAQLAMEGGYDDKVILAAFMHDVGPCYQYTMKKIQWRDME